MKTFYTTFDSKYKTWNAMDCATGACLFYGNIDMLEVWIKNTKHREVGQCQK